MDDNLIKEFALRMGDNCLILGQRLSAWCGHAPALEEDIAITNTALDLIGQTKLWLGLAATIDGGEKTADDLAFLRDGREFRNCLLVEQPNGNYGDTLMRQFLFDAWHYPMLQGLTKSTDRRVADIADKSLKEATYHLERSTDLVIRLGDGNEESHEKMQKALDNLWRFSGELMEGDDVDTAMAAEGAAPSVDAIKEQYSRYVSATMNEAALTIPEDVAMATGGRGGRHSEAFGFMLAEMQTLQRSFPGASW